MSQPYRTLRSFITLSVIGTGTYGVCQTPTQLEIAPVAISSDSMSPRYSQAGLIRVIEEAESQASKTSEKAADVPKSSGTSQPVQVQAKKGLIELAPLAIPNTSIQGIGTGVHPEDVTLNRLPPEQLLPAGETRIGDWGLQAKVWVPGGFCHQPLYFEDPMLERHGHVRFPCAQPAASAVRFFGTITLLPYLATLRHPLEEVHTLGAYRPGTAAPALRYRPHYDPVAIRNQAIVTAGAAVAIP